jgi:hypothetical protein
VLTGLHFARRAGGEVAQAVHDRPRGRVQRPVDLGSVLRRSWTAPRLAPSPPRAAARGVEQASRTSRYTPESSAAP